MGGKSQNKFMPKEKEKIPYDISEWKNEGIRRGYWAYFAEEEKKKWMEEIRQIMFEKDNDLELIKNLNEFKNKILK